MATSEKPARPWDIGDLLDVGKRSHATHLKAIPVLILEAWVRGERGEEAANYVTTNNLVRRLVDSELVSDLRVEHISNVVGALTRIQRGRNLTCPPLIKSQGRGKYWINLPHYEPLLQGYRRVYRENYPEDYRKLFPEREPKWERSKESPWRKILTVGSIVAIITLLVAVAQLGHDISETEQQSSAQETTNALIVRQVELFEDIVTIQAGAVAFPEGPTATAVAQELQTKVAEVAELQQLVTVVPFETTEAPDGSDIPGTWRPLDDFETGCIDSDTWTPYPGRAHLRENGCWRLEDWGIAAQDGGLLLSVGPTSSYQWQGIYTPLPPDADIQFKIRIDELQTTYARDANVALGIVSPVDLPTSDSPSSRFLFYHVTRSNSPVRVTLAEWNLTDRRSIQNYVRETDQQVKFSIHDSTLDIFLDEEQVAGPIDLHSMGYSQKAFWIGYGFSLNASLSASISDFKVTPR